MIVLIVGTKAQLLKYKRMDHKKLVLQPLDNIFLTDLKHSRIMLS